ncbi:MAG: hypothetical protein UY63_C0022G0005 [Parcubacteria group bacterium GW2011_GWA2_51_10]|nr:MAG: hypothetical protein UY63_C0022G0005 [Parcubacteria group bacterium GW2011_GWA2_51_10]
MADTIPNWVLQRYAILFRKYKDKEFTFKEAMTAIKEDDKVYASMVLSELRKAGWLEIKINPDDARRRIYTLIMPEEVMENIKVTI